MQPKAMAKADFITSIVLLAFSIALTEESWRMPRLVDQGINPWSAPGVVPGFLGLILLVLSLWLLFRSIVRGGYRLGWTKQLVQEHALHPGMMRMFTTLGLCVAYGLMLGRLPFWLATFIFVFAFTSIFEWDPELSKGNRKLMLVKAFLLAAGASAVVTISFQYGFLVTLP